MTTFVTYELAVDDLKRGTWVASEVGGELSGWAFIEPGGDVPQRPEGLWYTDSWQDPSFGVYSDVPEHESKRYRRQRSARSVARNHWASAYRRSMLKALGLSLGLALATILLAVALGYGD